MRKIIFSIIIFTLFCHEALSDQRVIIIGDSISEHIYCWPNEMRLENPHINLQLLTQSGRTIRDYSPPRDLRNVTGRDIVVYFLGINDAYGGYPMRYVNEAFSSHMVFLKQRGFKIFVILPPAVTKLKPQIDKVRAVITLQSQHLEIDYFELEFWDEAMTRDGLHPGPELSRMVAEFVFRLLEPELRTGKEIYLSECSPGAADVVSLIR